MHRISCDLIVLLDLSAEHPEISREGDEISDQQSSNMLPTVRTQRLSGSNSAAGDPLSIHDVHQRADRRSRHLAAQEDEERLPLSSMNLHGSATNSASSWPPLDATSTPCAADAVSTSAWATTGSCVDRSGSPSLQTVRCGAKRANSAGVTPSTKRSSSTVWNGSPGGP